MEEEAGRKRGRLHVHEKGAQWVIQADYNAKSNNQTGRDRQTSMEATIAAGDRKNDKRREGRTTKGELTSLLNQDGAEVEIMNEREREKRNSNRVVQDDTKETKGRRESEKRRRAKLDVTPSYVP